MIKKLESWQIVQKFLDVRTGIVLSFLVANTAALGWYCVHRGKAFPEGYTTALGIIFTAIMSHRITQTIKGKDNE